MDRIEDRSDPDLRSELCQLGWDREALDRIRLKIQNFPWFLDLFRTSEIQDPKYLDEENLFSSSHRRKLEEKEWTATN